MGFATFGTCKVCKKRPAKYAITQQCEECYLKGFRRKSKPSKWFEGNFNSFTSAQMHEAMEKHNPIVDGFRLIKAAHVDVKKRKGKFYSRFRPETQEESIIEERLNFD